MREIRDAAEEIIHTCVSGSGRTEGGVAMGIGSYQTYSNGLKGLIPVQGSYESIKVELTKYKPRIWCSNQRPAREPSGCEEVYDNMLLSTMPTFIRHVRQGVDDIVVPYEVLPSKLNSIHIP